MDKARGKFVLHCVYFGCWVVCALIYGAWLPLLMVAAFGAVGFFSDEILERIYWWRFDRETKRSTRVHAHKP